MFEDLELIGPNVDIAPFLEVCASDDFGVIKFHRALSVDIVSVTKIRFQGYNGVRQLKLKFSLNLYLNKFKLCMNVAYIAIGMNVVLSVTTKHLFSKKRICAFPTLTCMALPWIQSQASQKH